MEKIRISNFLDKRLLNLVFTMAHRDVMGKYNGSMFGFLWAIINPIFMLAVYTFAFGFIFKAKWAGVGDNPFDFALALFPALLVFNYFSDCVNRAPSMITGNTAYVKKVVFPLETLPLMACVSALFNFLVGILVWILAFFILKSDFHFTVFWMLIIAVPLFIFTAGVSIFLSALGVYLRDVQQFVGILTSAMIFMAPVFYSLESIPEKFRGYIELNPLTTFVELSRSVTFMGENLDFVAWSWIAIVSIVFFVLGIRWFNFTRKGFSDVL